MILRLTASMLVMALLACSQTNSPLSERTPPVPTPLAGAVVRGRVVDSIGEPLQEARVILAAASGSARSTRTDSTGAFRFDSLASGQYTLIVRAIGYEAASDSMQLGTADLWSRIWQLRKQRLSLDVICTLEVKPPFYLDVRDAVTGSNLTPTVRGHAMFEGDRLPFQVVAISAEGQPVQVSVASTRAGRYGVEVEHAGYELWRAEAVVERDECHLIPVRLTALLTPVPD